MTQERESATCIQLNIGAKIEAATGDFVKITVAPSTADFLNTASEDDIYNATEANPNLFKIRFGVAVADRAVRAQMLRWQKEKNLADGEVCQLRKAGHIVISPTEFKETPNRLVTISGKAQLTFLSIMCAIVILQVALGGAPELKRFAVQSAVAAFWFTGAFVLNRLFIEPGKILARIGH